MSYGEVLSCCIVVNVVRLSLLVTVAIAVVVWRTRTFAGCL